MFTTGPDIDSDSDPSPGDDEPTPRLADFVSRDELHRFYRDRIPEVWHQDTMRFLQNFYQKTAPDRYKRLYIESTHLRTHLTEVAETIQCRLDGRAPTRSLEEVQRAIELSISDLHYYIKQDKALKETFDVVVEGTNLIEDALMMLTTRALEDLTETHLALVEELQSFFFFYVWKYPCLRISQETATGPVADELRAEHAAEFETFDDEVERERAELEAKLDAEGLVPGPDDYPPVEDQQVAATLKDLSAEYFE
jgi:hypothetical protein